jgi:hypothetical protein
MKGRAFANGAVDQVGVGGIAQGEHLGLNGDEQLGGRVWKLAEHSLTADDDQLLYAGDARGGTDDVLKLRSLHGAGGCRP